MPTITNPSAPLHGDYRDFTKGGIYGPTGLEAPKAKTGEGAQLGGRQQFDYWETDPAKVNAYLQAHADDPAIIAAAQQGDKALDYELHNRGFRVPEHYKAGVGPDGQVTVQEMSWWDKQKNWALPALAVGGAIAAPAIAGALGGLGGGGAAAGAGGSSVLPSTAVSGLGATVAAPTSFGAAGAAGTGGGWGALAGAASKYARPIAGALNTAANTMAENRGTELSANQLADQVATNRQSENRNEREDAWKKLQNADYMQSTQGYTNPRGLPTYGIARTGPATPDVLRGAAGLEREALLRLENGPQIKPLTDVDKLAKPSKWEQLAGYGGLAASIYSGR